jgi:hypothetical protein
MMTQKRLRAWAAELRKLAEMMLEVARLRDAIQEAQARGRRRRLASDSTSRRVCALRRRSRARARHLGFKA